MNIYRVRYWSMSDATIEVEVEAEDVDQARQMVMDDFDKYLCAQVASVCLVRHGEETA